MVSINDLEKQLQHHKIALFVVVLFLSFMTAGVMMLSKQVAETQADNQELYMTESIEDSLVQ